MCLFSDTFLRHLFYEMKFHFVLLSWHFSKAPSITTFSNYIDSQIVVAYLTNNNIQNNIYYFKCLLFFIKEFQFEVQVLFMLCKFHNYKGDVHDCTIFSDLHIFNFKIELLTLTLILISRVFKFEQFCNLKKVFRINFPD